MKGNVINLNTLHLNSVRLNGIGKVQSVSLKGGSTEDPVFPPVEPPIEPEPTPTYTLSASVANGVVSATLNGVVVSLPFTANEGDVIVVEVTPNDGYEFNGWNDGNTDNPRSITMNADVALSAQCVEVVVEPDTPPIVNGYMQFEDAEVERILMSKGVSSDGIGITLEDAERVTSVADWFSGNTTITSFRELKYFGITSLSANAFRNCSNLTALDANWEKIVSIGNNAFQGTKLSFDTLRLYCTSLGDNALDGVGIKTLIFEKLVNLPIGGSHYQNYGSYEALETLVFKHTITSIPTYAFQLYANLREIDLSFSMVQSIGNYAFENTSKLSNELLFDNLSTLGASAFVNSGVTGISIKGPITTIPAYAFRKCVNVQYIDLPSSVESIGGSSFESCKKCERIICRATTPPTLGNAWVFAETNNCPIYVPDASLEAYKTATNWNQYADRIKPLSLFDSLVIIPNNETIYDSQVHLTALYKGVEVEAEYIVDSDIATIGANGLLTFSSAGVVVVTATYNGMTANSTIEYSPISIEHGVALNNNGTLTTNANYSVVGFVQTNGATSIKWGVTGGSLGTLCEYREDGTCQDYWGGSNNPRTVTIKSSSTQVKAAFSTANLDDAYIYDNTNGIYLWKGKNVE